MMCSLGHQHRVYIQSVSYHFGFIKRSENLVKRNIDAWNQSPHVHEEHQWLNDGSSLVTIIKCDIRKDAGERTTEAAENNI